jgi:hypothetical protein
MNFALDNGKSCRRSSSEVLVQPFTVKGQVILADKEYVKNITSLFKKSKFRYRSE